MDDDDNEIEYAAGLLRSEGWVVYKKPTNPTKWMVTASSGDGKHQVPFCSGTLEDAEFMAEGQIDQYVGSFPESGPIADWRYRVTRNSTKRGTP